MIEAKNLTKYYGKARGITDLNLKIEKGEIFGYIGPNGVLFLKKKVKGQ